MVGLYLFSSEIVKQNLRLIISYKYRAVSKQLANYLNPKKSFYYEYYTKIGLVSVVASFKKNCKLYLIWCKVIVNL